jgi:hypothetical protein
MATELKIIKEESITDQDVPLRIVAEEPITKPEAPLQIASQEPIAAATQAQRKGLWQRIREHGVATPWGRTTVGDVIDLTEKSLLPLTKLTERNLKRGVAPVNITHAGIPMGQVDISAGALHGMAGAIEGLATPRGAAMMAGLGMLTMPSLEFLGFLNSVGLTTDTAIRAYQSYKHAKEARAQGDEVMADAGYTEALIDGLFALGFLRHGVKGVQGQAKMAAKRDVDLLAKGLRSSNLDTESLDGITKSVQDAKNLTAGQKNYLLSIAVDRAKQMRPKGPLVAKPGETKPTQLTPVSGSKPSPTIRQQFNQPTQTQLPAEPVKGPTQPLPTIPGPAPKPEPPPVPMIEQLGRTWEESTPPRPYEEAIQQPTPATEPTLPIYPAAPETAPLGIPRRQAPTPPKPAPIQTPQKPPSQPAPAPAPAGRQPAEPAGSAQQFILGDKVKTPKGNGIILKTTVEPDGKRSYMVRVKNDFLSFKESALTAVRRASGGFQPNPDKSLMDAVLYYGGINPDNVIKSGLAGEWRDIPAEVKRRISRKDSRMKYEEIAKLVREHGYSGVDEQNLLYKLRDPAEAKRGIMRPEELNQIDRLMWENEQMYKELEALKAERDIGKGTAPDDWYDYEAKGEREPGQEGFALIRSFPESKRERAEALIARGEKLLIKARTALPGDERKGIIAQAERIGRQAREIIGTPDAETAEAAAKARAIAGEDSAPVDIAGSGLAFDEAYSPRSCGDPYLEPNEHVIDFQSRKRRLFQDEEGFAKFRDDRTGNLFEEREEFKLKPGAAPTKEPKLSLEEKREASRRAFEAEKARRAAVQKELPTGDQGPLFEKPLSEEKIPESQASRPILSEEAKDAPKTSDNAGRNIANIVMGSPEKKAHEKSHPISEIADQLAALQEESRATAKDEIQNRILQAPDDTSTGKRQQLGISRPKEAQVEGPLFGKKQKGLFGNEEGFARIGNEVEQKKPKGVISILGDIHEKAQRRAVPEDQGRYLEAGRRGDTETAREDQIRRTHKLSEQTITTISQADNWLQQRGLKPSGSWNIVESIEGLQRHPDWESLSDFDKARLQASLERPELTKTYAEHRLRDLQKAKTTKSKGEVGIQAAGSTKTKDSGILSDDTVKGCDRFCIECYGTSAATRHNTRYDIPVRRKLHGLLHSDQVLRLGTFGDPGLDWAHTNRQVKSVMERSRAAGHDVDPKTHVFGVTPLLDLKNYDPKLMPNLEVTLDPIQNEKMTQSMINILRLKAQHPEVNIAVRIRSLATKSPELRASQDQAVEFANRFDLQVIETKMRWRRKVTFNTLDLDSSAYSSDPVAKQFKLNDSQLRGKARKLEVCDEHGMGCPGCLSCRRAMIDYRAANIAALDTAMRREGIETGSFRGVPKAMDVRGPAVAKLFGSEEGFARFHNTEFENDPQLKAILNRLERADRAGRRAPFNVLPNPFEEDVPGSHKHAVSWIRSANHALGRDPETAPVAKEIVYAARDKKKAMQAYDDLANKIVKEAKIKKNSEEDRMVRDLLDEAYTGLTPEKLRASLAYMGNKEAAIKAAERMRNEIFEPIIAQIRNNPELVEIIGERGYIRGYFPHWMEQLKRKYGEKEYLKMARALMPEQFISRFLKERESDQWANNVSVYDVVPAYISSTMRTIHDIPAYNRALKLVEKLEDGPGKDFAKWYAQNYMGEPAAREGLLANNETYQKYSRWVANRYYDSLIGLNWKTWAVNTGQTLTNTFPELGAAHTAAGIKALFTKEGRKQFHESGLLLDRPGMESDVIHRGTVRQVLHSGMAAGEYLNRGIAYLGGLSQAKEMGLVGRAAEHHAMDIVEKTQFTYSKEGAIRYLENLPPDLRVFQTFPLKEAEFVVNLVEDAYKGGRAEKAKLGRFMALNVLLAGGLAAAGVETKNYFIGVLDLIPKPFRTFQLQTRLMRYLNNVYEGKVKVEDIPMDVLEGLYDAFGPASNVGKQTAKRLGLIEDKRKKAANQ